MDDLTLERLGPRTDVVRERPVNRWGDLPSQIARRQEALRRGWRDS